MYIKSQKVCNIRKCFDLNRDRQFYVSACVLLSLMENIVRVHMNFISAEYLPKCKLHMMSA